MNTKLFYYLILFVYVLLWICQLVACHLTHSLIILTDSYINLYRIFDISLGILHLSTQQSLTKSRHAVSPGADCSSALQSSTIMDNNSQTMAYKIFASTCTFQYKRLPLLGSFVNGMFLAALLMSSAIEGIQTCLHVKHSESSGQKNILTENVATYPIVLVGFAFVGLVMQYCSLKAHEMREEELCSDSYLDLTKNKSVQGHDLGQAYFKSDKTGANGAKQVVIGIKELNVNNLNELNGPTRINSNSNKRRSYDLNLNRLTPDCCDGQPVSSQLNHKQSLHNIPLTDKSGEIPTDQETRISLKSLRLSNDMTNAFDSVLIDRDLEAKGCCNQNKSDKSIDHKQPRSSSKRDNWFYVRYLASPMAMLVCAAIFYLIDNELMTEISDAALAVSVVVLLFAASYPPIKKAGKILLQTVPDGVDLEKLQRELLHCSGNDIIKVEQLRVWSLTWRTNRVATCMLVLDPKRVTTKKQVQQIIQEARFKFLDQNIKCTTIQPVLVPEEHRQIQQQHVVES